MTSEKIPENIRYYNHDKDYSSLKRFAEVVWPDKRLMIDPRRLIWQYVGNPYRLESECSTLYVFVDDHSVLGTLGTMPVEFHFGKQKVHVRWLTDYYVRPSNKGKGIGGSLLRHCMKEHRMLMAAGTGPESYPLFMKSGFSEVPGYCNFCHYSLPSLIQIIRKPKEVVRSILHFGKTLNSIRVNREPKGNLCFKEIEYFTSEMVNLTDEILSENNRSIYVNRTVEFMNWKYATIDGMRDYKLFEISDGENIVGWTIFACNYEKLRGIIVDLCLKEIKEKEYFSEILNYAIQYFIKKGMIYVLSLADEALGIEYKQSGYYSRGSLTKFLYYTTEKELNIEIGNQEKNTEQPWFLSYGESDLILSA